MGKSVYAYVNFYAVYCKTLNVSMCPNRSAKARLFYFLLFMYKYTNKF